MTLEPAWLAFGGAMALACTVEVEVALGFGSIVIALAMGVLLLPMSALLPVLVPCRWR